VVTVPEKTLFRRSVQKTVKTGDDFGDFPADLPPQHFAGFIGRVRFPEQFFCPITPIVFCSDD